MATQTEAYLGKTDYKVVGTRPIRHDRRRRGRPPHVWATAQRDIEDQNGGAGAHDAPEAVGRAALPPQISRDQRNPGCPHSSTAGRSTVDRAAPCRAPIT